MIPKPYPGQEVRLAPTSDPAGGDSPLEGAPGVVHAVFGWGALVKTGRAATGEYRAAHGEMEPLAGTNGHSARAGERLEGAPESEPGTGAGPNPGHGPEPTGDQCQRCGSPNMTRAGTCLLCRDCGDTSGGCG